jgi:hypothetical protein
MSSRATARGAVFLAALTAPAPLAATTGPARALAPPRSAAAVDRAAADPAYVTPGAMNSFRVPSDGVVK